jgi:hypothetical protein
MVEQLEHVSLPSLPYPFTTHPHRALTHQQQRGGRRRGLRGAKEGGRLLRGDRREEEGEKEGGYGEGKRQPSHYYMYRWHWGGERGGGSIRCDGSWKVVNDGD